MFFIEGVEEKAMSKKTKTPMSTATVSCPRCNRKQPKQARIAAECSTMRQTRAETTRPIRRVALSAKSNGT